MASHQYKDTTVTNSSNTCLGDKYVNNYYAGKADEARYLKVAQGAAFDDLENENEPSCLPQTRKTLLAQIAQWADDPEGKCIFWLHGAAGMGKSTISRTVAKNFADEGKLTANFFFNRAINDCRKADLFVTTIAHQLIHTVTETEIIQELNVLVRDVIHKCPDLPRKALKTQFEHLILGPLSKLRPTGSSTTTLVIAIDALDECDNEGLIMGLLGELVSVTSIRIRVFITSRPELPIQWGFEDDVLKSTHQDVALHEIPPSEIEHDIRAYLEDQLKQIRSRHRIPAPWPDSESMAFLVQRSSPLFIYAATICRLMDSRTCHPTTQLEEILASPYESMDKVEMTYGTVLDQLMSGLNERVSQNVITRFCRIVGGIILLAEPLSVVSLSRLLDDKEHEVFLHLKNLRAVLSVPDDQKSDQPVKVFHQSFPEYLLGRNGAKSQFLIKEQQKHADLFDCCLRVMKNGNHHCLKDDICRLKDPGVLRREVAPKKVRENIPQHLKYACMYWVHHLEKIHCPTNKTEIFDCRTNETKVYDFLTRFFIHWLEAMSWLGRIEQCANDVRKLQAIFDFPGSAVAFFLKDAGTFVAEHKYTIDRAPCQVYVSALLFSPINSRVKQTFQSEIPKWVLTAPEVATTWDVAQRSLHKYRSGVRGMCYSHDGVYLAVATKNEVNIWNVDLNTICAAKDNFTSELSCLVFRSAHDVAVGLVSGSVVFWDWQHDQQSIENLSESCVAYISSSHNGCLICGFSDGDVYLWKPNFGILYEWETCWRSTCNRWKGQTGISYSVDGKFLAIIRKGCPDYIDVYDADSGCPVQEVRARKGRAFGSLAILPDHSLLTISGPCNMRLWDFDGIVQADQMERWNLIANKKTLLEKVSFISHSYLRPDMNQSKIMCLHKRHSGLDIWDMRGTPVLMQTVQSVDHSCFSPDGRYVAASNDGHVTIIDTFHLLPHEENTQNFRLSQEAKEYWLSSEARCSPDGSRLGTISSHGRVIVWDFPNGKAVSRLLDPPDPLLNEGHHGLTLTWSVHGTSLVVATPNELITYTFLSGHEPAKDKYPLELTADGDSEYKLTRRHLCCSSRGSYLAMMHHAFPRRCEIVIWKWEDHSVTHFWTKDLGLKSDFVAGRSTCLTFSADEKWLACLAPFESHYTLVLINVQSGRVEWQTKIDGDWHPKMIAFDSVGSYIVIGARAASLCRDVPAIEQHHHHHQDGMEVISEDSEGDDNYDNDNNYDDARARAAYAFVCSIREGGQFLQSEPIQKWDQGHAKSFSVGLLGVSSMEPHHWLRLEHIAEQFDRPGPAKGISCHVYVRWVDGDYWVMKGGRRKVLLPEDYGSLNCIQNWSSLPHHFFGYNRSREMPWLIELDCCNCVFPSNFLEKTGDN